MPALEKNITRDYSGRTVDLEILQSTRHPEASFSSVELSLSSKQPAAVSGISKLIQRYTLVFLSLANDVNRPFFNIGTSFISDVLGGARRTSDFLLHSFSFANGDTVRQLRREDADWPDTPDDERIAYASLNDMTVDRGTLTLKLVVDISSLAGNTAKFVVPISYPRIQGGPS